MAKLKILDLFSGIGGFSLGLERAGMETVAFCEIDPHARAVLKKHWPDVVIYEDVKKLKGKNLKTSIDVICGGFPCQDISSAGKGVGIEGERSGLWKEYCRLIKEIKPRYVIVENVANLRSKGLTKVLKDLWAIGYDCEWHIISARSVSAPHLRERIWIIAYPKCEGSQGHERCKGVSKLQKTISKQQEDWGHEPGGCIGTKQLQVANTHNFRFWQPFATEEEKSEWWAKATAGINHWAEVKSVVCGVDDGLSRGVDRYRRERIKQLGNAVVPQIPELIGRAIVEYENSRGHNGSAQI